MLQSSARERRLWAVAIAAGVVSAVVLAYGALSRDPRHPLRTWTAAGLAAAAVGIAVARRWRAAPFQREMRIAADGVPWIRVQLPAGSPAEERPAQAVFVAPWLITLHADATWVAVWPDSLTPDAFRRLHACVRWARSELRPETDPRLTEHDHDPSD